MFAVSSSSFVNTLRRYMRGGTEVARFLDEHGASQPLRTFALRYSSLSDVWQKCERADWMLWMLNAIEVRPGMKLREFASFCAHQCDALITDDRSRDVLASLDEFINFELDWEEVVVLRPAAYNVLNQLQGMGHELAEAAAWTVASAAKEDAFTAAYDTCLHAMKVAELRRRGASAAYRAQADKLRQIVGNPF
jgi:hypothetical protein